LAQALRFIGTIFETESFGPLWGLCVVAAQRCIFDASPSRAMFCCTPANQFCCGCSLSFGTAFVILANIFLVGLTTVRAVGALFYPEAATVTSLPLQIFFAAFALASLPFLCFGIHGVARKDEVTLRAYAFYLVLAVGLCIYSAVQLGISLSCSALPDGGAGGGAYVCGMIEIIDVVFVSLLVFLLLYGLYVVWSQVQDLSLGGSTKFSDLEESYGSMEAKKLLEASHNILSSMEDEGLGSMFSDSQGDKVPVSGFGDSSKLFGYSHEVRFPPPR